MGGGGAGAAPSGRTREWSGEPASTPRWVRGASVGRGAGAGGVQGAGAAARFGADGPGVYETWLTSCWPRPRPSPRFASASTTGARGGRPGIGIEAAWPVLRFRGTSSAGPASTSLPGSDACRGSPPRRPAPGPAAGRTTSCWSRWAAPQLRGGRGVGTSDGPRSRAACPREERATGRRGVRRRALDRRAVVGRVDPRVRRRNSSQGPGQLLVFSPSSFRYQLAQPPVIQIVSAAALGRSRARQLGLRLRAAGRSSAGRVAQPPDRVERRS